MSDIYDTINKKGINMAGITELKAMLQDNPQAMEIVSNIENTMGTTTEKVMGLEKQVGSLGNELTEAINARDKVKDIVRNELGIEEFTPDAVRNKLATYASDDAIAAREKQFNELKASSSAKLEELQKEIHTRDEQMNKMKLQLAISKTDVMGQTQGEHASEMLLNWIAQDATFDEQGNIQYKGPSGETLYNENSEPMTLEDRINQIKADEGQPICIPKQIP